MYIPEAKSSLKQAKGTKAFHVTLISNEENRNERPID